MNDFLHDSAFINTYTALNVSGAPIGENDIDLYSYVERSKAYCEEYKYNLSLAMSKFKLIGAKENNIDPCFFFSVLIETGSICAFNPKTLKSDIVVQPYNTIRWNYYAQPTNINIIPYYSNGVTLDKLGLMNSRELTADEFEIIYLNKNKIGFAESLAYEARLCSMLDICFLNNVLAKSLNILLRGKQDDENDFEQIKNKIFNQNGIIALYVDSKDNVNELITSIDLNCEWLGDKILETKKQLRAELHERLGITHTPYEKKERLITTEIETQNEATDLMAQSTLDTINECLEKCNDKFKLKTPLRVEFTNIGIDKGDGENVNINEVKEIDTQE